jgi:hypothetical protein
MSETGDRLRSHYPPPQLKNKILIKVIKRDIGAVPPADPAKKLKQKRQPTMTATVNDWIAESRQNRLDSDRSSRRTIDDWASATDN